MSDRSVVRRFFEYELDNEKITKGSVKLKIPIILALIASSVGFLKENPLLVAGLASITFFIFYMINFVNLNSEHKNRIKKQKDNHREFELLLNQTRSIMGNDLVRSFLRVFERTQIDRQQLRILEKKYSSSKERDLLSEETLEEKLGDLENKSIRFVSKGNFKKGSSKIDYDRLVLVKESGLDQINEFFNPMRLVVLFLTETQLVICDVQIDSIEGNLREEIQRISLSKIVNVHFAAERTRVDWDYDKIVKTAQNLQFSEEEIKEIRDTFQKKDGPEEGGKWTIEEVSSQLIVTRTDSGSLSFPIRNDPPYFGKQKSALDQANTLTVDEIMVDRMVNELNRLVEYSK